MSKLKTVVSAVLVEEYLNQIKEVTNVTEVGWAVENGKILSEDECIAAFGDADIMITGVDQITRRVIDACPKLRLIACPRANPVNVDVAAASERKIPVIFTPGRNANSVAEFLLGELIALIRNIALSYHEIRNGAFLGPESPDIYSVPPQDDIVWGFNMKGPTNPFLKYHGYEMFGRSFGMIGYGAVGRRLSRFLNAMDVKVLIYDPYLPEGAEGEGVERRDLESLLRESDFVSVHCKVTPETKDMIGEKEFALMKPTAVFINTARGIIVNQRALMNALTEKRIAGAVLDVFWEEPLPANHPLLKMDNVVFTPHIAGDSDDVPKHHSIMIAQDVIAFVKGEALSYVFNRKALG